MKSGYGVPVIFKEHFIGIFITVSGGKTWLYLSQSILLHIYKCCRFCLHVLQHYPTSKEAMLNQALTSGWNCSLILYVVRLYAFEDAISLYHLFSLLAICSGQPLLQRFVQQISF